MFIELIQLALFISLALVLLWRERIDLRRLSKALTGADPVPAIAFDNPELRRVSEKWRYLAVRKRRSAKTNDLLEIYLQFEAEAPSKNPEQLARSFIQLLQNIIPDGTISVIDRAEGVERLLASSSPSGSRLVSALSESELSFKAESGVITKSELSSAPTLSTFGINYHVAYTFQDTLLLHIGWPTFPLKANCSLIDGVVTRGLAFIAQTLLLQREREVHGVERDNLISLSHDLRHPSNCALSLVRELRERDPTSQLISDLEDLLREQLRILGDYIDLTRDKLGTLRARPAELSIEELFHTLKFSPSLQNLPISLSFQIKTGATLFIDRNHLERVLANLILNALKHSSASQIEIESSELPSGEVSISVSDDGKGLPKELEGKLFKPLTEVRFGGCGLGLSICRVLTELNGCSLSYARRSSGGSRFTVLVPAALVIPAPKQRHFCATLPQERRSVLIAEDDDATARFYVRTVQAIGHSPIRVRSREGLLNYIYGQGKVDLLCADLTFGDGEITDDLIKLKHRGLLPPTIIVTGREVDDLQLPGVRFIQKPIEADELLREVNEMSEKIQACTAP